MVLSSRTVEELRQQESNTSDNEKQISKNRRILFPDDVNCCHQTTLRKPFIQPLPDQFKVLATRPRAINYFFQLVEFNTFSFVEKTDRKKMKLVDIAEARWESQPTLARKWGVSLQAVKDIERVLKKAGIITTTVRGKGIAQTRYYAFSEIFQSWLKAGNTVQPVKPQPKRDKPSNKVRHSNGCCEHPNYS